MKRWILGFVLLGGTAAGLYGLVAQGHTGAEGEAGPTALLRLEVSFQVGPTTPGALEKHVTGGTRATIEAHGLGLNATTDENGHAELSTRVASNGTQSEAETTDVLITAPGYGSFTYLNVPLAPDSGLILTPILGPEARIDDLGRLTPPSFTATPNPTPNATADATSNAIPDETASPTPSGTADATPDGTADAKPTAAGNAATGGAMESSALEASCPPLPTPIVGTELGGSSCDGFSSTGSPPPSINVYFDYLKNGIPDCQIHQVWFKDYVKQVLPNEWGVSWNRASLDAGAVAVKMYGWERKLFWRYSINGSCASVDSGEISQVWTPAWDPYVQSEPTNQAVEETWGYRLMEADGYYPYVYETLHRAGFEDSYGQCLETCAQLNGTPAPGSIMSQCGSKACGDPPNNWTWWHILEAYYFDPQSSLVFGCPQDTDCDGYGDWADNCPSVYNPDQTNSDRRRDNGPKIPNQYTSNPASDWLGDACDTDKDNDRLPDSSEYGLYGCPNITVADSDADRAQDGWEVYTSYDPCSASSAPSWSGGGDSDGDHLLNGSERRGYTTCISSGDTYPGWTGCAEPMDSDGDGCSDMVEALDFNGDRRVNSTDVGLMNKRFAGKIDPDPVSDAIFDVNKDGGITSADTGTMNKYNCLTRYGENQIGCPECPPE